jgi:hypothetical protein
VRIHFSNNHITYKGRSWNYAVGIENIYYFIPAVFFNGIFCSVESFIRRYSVDLFEVFMLATDM